MQSKKLSIIIPCRNEEAFIKKCLDSILSNEFALDELEILVIDGRSTDKTRLIVKEFAEKYPQITLLDNPKKITPCALNIGIQNAKGDIIIRVDAHATYAKDYFLKCVRHLQESNADNVGGITKTVPGGKSIMAQAIAKTYEHPLGVGSSFFRIGSNDPKEVDTVFGGCYKRELFTKIGMFNEQLTRSQDIEFNLRLRRSGGKILLFPDIVSYYYAKSTLKDFFWHNVGDGVWALYPLKFIKTPLSVRHYIPLLFVVGMLGMLFFGLFSAFFMNIFLVAVTGYLFVIALTSIQVAWSARNLNMVFAMPLTLIARHFGYGIGSIVGIIKLLI